MPSTITAYPTEQVPFTPVDPLLSSCALSAVRPLSQATEFAFSDDDVASDGSGSAFEDECPRFSFNSDARRSQTTISSFDGPQTPRFSQRADDYVQIRTMSTIQGPKGPHLFRMSVEEVNGTTGDEHEPLQLSPILIKSDAQLPLATAQFKVTPPSPQKRTTGPPAAPRILTSLPPPPAADEPTSAMVILDESKVRAWTTHNVADWFYNQGFEESICEKFELNDIDGSILLSMRFEDLKELGIASFGRRHQIWNELAALRAACSFTPIGRSAPPPQFPISSPSRYDAPSFPPPVQHNRPNVSHPPVQPAGREVTFSSVQQQSSGTLQRSMSVRDKRRSTQQSASNLRRGRFSMQNTADITPAESVSIVALNPPQFLSQNEDHTLKRQGTYVSTPLSDTPIAASPDTLISQSSVIDVEGPGTPPAQHAQLRPDSGAILSMVASSDVLGSHQPPLTLLEGVLAGKHSVHDNVNQFLDFQYANTTQARRDNPPSPQEEAPLEMFPAQPRVAPAQLTRLPRLSIPEPPPSAPPTMTTFPSDVGMAYTMEPGPVAKPFSAGASPTTYINRFGTPASEMDVPLSHFSLNPVPRNASSSVPPNMQYRPQAQQIPGPATSAQSSGHHRRTSSQDTLMNFSRRQPLILSPVIEASPRDPSFGGFSRAFTAPTTSSNASSQKDLRAPTKSHTAPAPLNSRQAWTRMTYGEATTHAGWMRKRKTRLLRHEWQDAHFRLHGTNLAMHRSEHPDDQLPLDTIDVTKYGIVCASLPADSKLNAALKTLKLRSDGPHSNSQGHGRRSSMDDAAFAFQLVPNAPSGANASSGQTSSPPRPRMRERGASFGGHISSGKLVKNAPGSDAGSSGSGAFASSGKAHTFAVRSRDDRIDWMREVMLAKAVQQKQEGFEVSVNGTVV